MGHAHNGSEEIRNPGSFQISGGMKMMFWVFVVIGIGSFLGLLKMEEKRAWSIFVVNHFYFFSLCVAGLFFAAIQWITGAMWSAPVRRLGEAFTSYFPVALISSIVVFVGIHHIYEWSHTEVVQNDIILKAKSGYLSSNFLIIRDLGALFLLWFFAKKMIGNSIKQDTTKDYALTAKNRTMSPPVLILFGVGFTMIAFDQIMSLDPHWFSTMFGVYCFAGAMYSFHAALTLLTFYLIRTGHLKDVVNSNHIHDLGKWMFVFTVFWAYIGFSQFMLIWYANLPEETGYFLKRFAGEWGYVSVFLLVGKFIFPFLMLISRHAKRNVKLLTFMAWWMLVAQWVDVVWMVQPEFFADGPRVVPLELLVTLGFVGAFGLVVARFLGKHNVLAIGDPRLSESVFHHHQ
ncbi:MAG: molybdopterin oxidoreductase [Bacteriovoracia bacterium]